MTRLAGFDHVIVGAGVSGLLLADALLERRERILLVDRQLASPRRVTLAFWATGRTPLDAWALNEWDSLRVIGHDGQDRAIPLQEHRYRAIAWDRARQALLDRMAAAGVTVLEAHVDAVADDAAGARVLADGTWHRGRWAYDSRPRAEDPKGLHQAFRGVWVTSSRPWLDPSAATLLDFSADDGPDLGFAYVLPVDASMAMVMAVRMGARPQLPDPIPAIPRELGADGWEVIAEEVGVTELAVGPRARREGARVLAIGTRGGRVRASTGYSVTRIITDSQAIAGSLARHGHPFAIPPDPLRDRLLDAIWLRALARERAALEPAFLRLFAGAPIDGVLRFLDGRAGPRDVLQVVAALPPGPFLRAALGAAADSVRP